MARPAAVVRMTYAEYLAAEAVAVLVSRAEPLIEVYRRTEGGRFEARAGETIELASIGARLDVNAVYANPLGTATV